MRIERRATKPTLHLRHLQLTIETSWGKRIDVWHNIIVFERDRITAVAAAAAAAATAVGVQMVEFIV